MNVSETLTYLDQQITLQKASLKNSLFILSMPIEDTSVGSIEDAIIKYYNNQLISCKVKRCNMTGEFEISIWW
jgi:hypothetical protein